MCDFHRNQLKSVETALYLISILRCFLRFKLISTAFFETAPQTRHELRGNLTRTVCFDVQRQKKDKKREYLLKEFKTGRAEARPGLISEVSEVPDGPDAEAHRVFGSFGRPGCRRCETHRISGKIQPFRSHPEKLRRFSLSGAIQKSSEDSAFPDCSEILRSFKDIRTALKP